MQWQPHSVLYKKETQSYSKSERQFFAQTIWNDQIRLNDKMACALNYKRDLLTGEGDNCMFLRMSTRMPLGKRGVFNIYVFLMPSDTYRVLLVQTNTKPKASAQPLHVLEEQDNIYCEELSETIYRMCNK